MLWAFLTQYDNQVHFIDDVRWCNNRISYLLWAKKEVVMLFFSLSYFLVFISTKAFLNGINSFILSMDNIWTSCFCFDQKYTKHCRRLNFIDINGRFTTEGMYSSPSSIICFLHRSFHYLVHTSQKAWVCINWISHNGHNWIEFLIFYWKTYILRLTKYKEQC